jgi:GntR family transcriptional regulator/MocR family aminotransferase
MHLMIRLQSQFNDEEVVGRAKQENVGLVSARIYYLCDARQDEFVLGYANLSERKIQEGIKRLARSLK